MGLAIDTIVGRGVNPGAGPTATVPSVGDSFTIRNFTAPASAKILRITRAGVTTGFVQVRSPLLHDAVRGIRFTTAQNPAAFAMPQEIGQPVQAQDTLTVELSGGAAETDLAILLVYYTNLLGGAARLHSIGDIAPLVANIKPVEVDCVASATPGLWVDTVMTATENLLQANTDYAVLGYVVDVPVSAVGVRGQDTGNLRVTGPGTALTEDTSDYFVRMSDREGIPCIPVINSANAGGTFVSVVDVGVSTAVKAQLVLAELSQNLSS